VRAAPNAAVMLQPSRLPGIPSLLEGGVDRWRCRRLVDERGWQDTTTAAGVLANWASVVGPEIADHCQPVSLLDGDHQLRLRMQPARPHRLSSMAISIPSAGASR